MFFGQNYGAGFLTHMALGVSFERVHNNAPQNADSMGHDLIVSAAVLNGHLSKAGIDAEIIVHPAVDDARHVTLNYQGETYSVCRVGDGVLTYSDEDDVAYKTLDTAEDVLMEVSGSLQRCFDEQFSATDKSAWEDYTHSRLESVAVEFEDDIEDRPNNTPCTLNAIQRTFDQ